MCFWVCTTFNTSLLYLSGMDYFQAIILGIIQGITEWLPVSSSGHLALIQNFFGMTPPVVFDMLLHIGTLAAVLIYFRKDILDLIKGFLSFDKNNKDFQISILIILASIPTAIIGFTLHDFFESMFSNILYVGIALIITGIILFLTRNLSGKLEINPKIAFLMGIAQGFAVAPGISRSGITISTGMLLGLEKQKAARFSFLLFIPAIIGAMLFKLSDISSLGPDIGPAIVGTIISAITGYLAIDVLLKLINKNQFSIFSYYCLLLGLVIIILSL